MFDLWKRNSKKYGEAKDLEEKQRRIVAERLSTFPKNSKILELGCWNGKILKKIHRKNPNIRLFGIDASPEMVNVAKKELVDGADISVSELLESCKVTEALGFNAVYCVNTLHNLPSEKDMEKAVRIMANLTKPGGLVIFDIRNSCNPFIWYGYWKNRRGGLQFHTVFPRKLQTVAKNSWLVLKNDISIHYDSLSEYQPGNRNFLKGVLYRIYLAITRIPLFSPYRLFFFEKAVK